MINKIDKILVFGASGLLGKCFIDYYKDKKNIFVAINKTKLKIKNINFIDANKLNLIKKYIKKKKINVIINFAGLTNIEICEKNVNLSKKSNYILPINLADLSRECNVKYIFISTDNFEFNSKKLSENSNIKSLNIYSKHKKQSEEDIIRINPKALIIRTNFYCVGNEKRQSFSDMIINQTKSNKEIKLFKDVYYTPIYGKYLLKYIFVLLKKNKFGIFNVCSNERITKYQFGHKVCKIFHLDKRLIKMNYLKKKKDLVKRPLNMALNNYKLKKTLKIKIPSINYQLQIMKKDYKFL